jgi:hypothetical protein
MHSVGFDKATNIDSIGTVDKPEQRRFQKRTDVAFQPVSYRFF